MNEHEDEDRIRQRPFRGLGTLIERAEKRGGRIDAETSAWGRRRYKSLSRIIRMADDGWLVGMEGPALDLIRTERNLLGQNGPDGLVIAIVRMITPTLDDDV